MTLTSEELARLISQGIRTPQEGRLLSLPRTEDVTDIPPEGIKSVLQRSDDSLGGVFTAPVRGESAREKAFRVNRVESLRTKEREARARAREIRERPARQQAAAREQASQQQLRDREGQAKLTLANAALTKARAGEAAKETISDSAARLLNIPDFAGKVSPETGRAGARIQSTERLAGVREERLSKKEGTIIRKFNEIKKLAKAVGIEMSDEDIFEKVIQSGGKDNFFDALMAQVLAGAKK